MMEDLYALLGLEPSASRDEIRRAYRKRVIRSHRAGVLALEDKLARTHAAFEVLSDPERRREYDAQRRREGIRLSSKRDPEEETERLRRDARRQRRYAKERAAHARRQGRDASANIMPLVEAIAREHDARESAWQQTLRRRAALRRAADVAVWLAAAAAVAWAVARWGWPLPP